ncbi:hypothetical protein HHI36_015414 [Cryptolaemus montrouzieri]|uniref:Uncharacterized protein n=1 Tax=Cryptolaemus montrouzieri TaxID=559131 RepID=A0ABD2N5G5_9CUCU
MEAVKLHDLNLDDLRYAQHKLHKFDEILEKNLNQPFIVQHSTSFNFLMGCIALIVALLMFFLCCCNGKCRRCKRLLSSLLNCFRKEKHHSLQICINSHNTISQNSLGETTDALPEFRMTRLRAKEFKERSPSLKSLQIPLNSQSACDHQYEAIKTPPSTSRSFLHC